MPYYEETKGDVIKNRVVVLDRYSGRCNKCGRIEEPDVSGGDDERLERAAIGELTFFGWKQIGEKWICGYCNGHYQDPTDEEFLEIIKQTNEFDAWLRSKD